MQMREDGTTQPRNVHVFGATSFLNDTATEMAYWILPAFLTSIGAGPAALGVIEGIAESVASFAKLFSGLWTDRLRRRKPLVVSGYVVANVVKPLLALASSASQVLGIRFLDRLAKGVRGAPRDVLLSESVPRERVGAAFGLLQAMDSAGAIVGPLLALAIMGSSFGHAWGPRAVFVAAGVPGLMCIFVVWIGLRETPRRRSEVSRKQLFADPRQLPASFYFVMAAIGIFSLGNSSDMFLVLRAQGLGVGAGLAPLLGLVFNLTYTAASWPAGRLSDYVAKQSNNNGGAIWSRHAIASAGLFVFAAVYGMFAMGPSRAGVFAVMAFYGLYYALTQPVLKAIVVEAVPGELRGGAFGIYYFVTSVMAFLASAVTGELWKLFGPRVPLMLSSGLAAVGAMMLLAGPVLFPRKAAA
jgi:MFS family permease